MRGIPEHMPAEAKAPAPYDADAGAKALSAPMSAWAKSGFLRGFAGVHGETLPRGQVHLPSTAFLDAVTERLGEGSPDEREMERRLAYMEAVIERLHDIQSKCIRSHYRAASWGRVADFAMALMVLGLMAGLFHRVGVYHPLTAMFLVLFATKLGFMHYAARRAVKLARSAFRPSKDEVRLPWDGPQAA